MKKEYEIERVRNPPKYRRFLQDERGEGYVDVLIGMAILLSLLMCFVAMTPIFTQKLKLDQMANVLARTIELTGESGTQYHADYANLQELTGLSPSISLTGNFFEGGKIQLREPFSLTLTDTVEVILLNPSFGTPVVLHIPIRKTVNGRGEVYHKMS